MRLGSEEIAAAKDRRLGAEQPAGDRLTDEPAGTGHRVDKGK